MADVLRREGRGTWVQWLTTDPQRVKRLVREASDLLQPLAQVDANDGTDSHLTACRRFAQELALSRRARAGLNAWREYAPYPRDVRLMTSRLAFLPCALPGPTQRYIPFVYTAIVVRPSSLALLHSVAMDAVAAPLVPERQPPVLKSCRDISPILGCATAFQVILTGLRKGAP